MRTVQRLFLLFLLLSPLYYLPLAWTYNPQAPDYTAYRAGKDVATLALIAVWGLVLIARRRALPLRPTPLTAAVLLHALTLMIASIGIERGTGLDVNFAVRTLVPLGLYFLARDLLRHESAKRAALGVLVSVGVVVAMVALFEWGFRPEPSVFTRAAGGQFRAVGTLVNPLSLGWYLAFVAALVAGAGVAAVGPRAADVPWWARGLVALFVQAALLAGIVASGTRSALIAFGLVVLASIAARCWLALLRTRVARRVLVSTAMVLGIAAVAVALSGVLPLRGSAVETGLEQPLRVLRGPETTRWSIYADLVDEMSRRPLNELVFGLSTATLAVLDEQRLNTDSFVLLLLTQGGIASLSTWLLTIVMAFWAALAGGSRHDVRPVGGAVAFGLGALAAMAAIGNVLYLFPHGAMFWILIGAAARDPEGEQR